MTPILVMALMLMAFCLYGMMVVLLLVMQPKQLFHLARVLLP
ncbi:MAG: hypothetical protein ACPGQL_06925 [Thermoplasmatota archaeon]